MEYKRIGPCTWNGNEIVEDTYPHVGIAGLAPNAPEWLGPIFAAAPTLLACLKSVEWSGLYWNGGNYEECCPSCDKLKDSGHAPDCQLDAAIKAGE